MRRLLAVCACTAVTGVLACGSPTPATAPTVNAPVATTIPSPGSSPSPAALIASPIAVPSPSVAAAPDKLSVGISAISPTQLLAVIAQQQGFFEQNGLDVDVVTIVGGTATAALLSGQIQALQISTKVLQADLSGADLVYVAAPISVESFSLVAPPSVHGAADLKGKSIGVTGVGTATYTSAKLALQYFQLDESDVTLVSLTDEGSILSAVESGQVAAGVLGMPGLAQAQKDGMQTMVDLAQLGVPFPSSWDAVSRSYLVAHPDVVRRFVKSITQSIAYMIQNPAQTQQMLGQFTSTTDPQILQESYDAVAPYLLRVPEPDLQAVRNGLQDLAETVPEAANADPSQFVDDQFVQELKNSGYIDSLYQ